jgi:electron transfer flavoprotein alpha subunit
MFVYLEHSEGKLADVSLELISKAKEITNGESIYGMLFGHKVNNLAEESIRSGLDEVYVIDDKHLLNYTPEAFTRCAEAIVEKYKPDTILIGATQNGCDMAGRLAVTSANGTDCSYYWFGG